MAAACLEAGAKTYPINKQLFETTRLCRLRLNAYMAQHLELLQGGTLALCLIPLEVERETGVTEDDLEDVSNFARNVEGVQLAVTFRTVECGDTKLSVRSAPGYDAAAYAPPWGAAATPRQPEPPCTATRPRPGPGFWRCSGAWAWCKPCDPRLERRPHGHWNHSHR